MFETQHIIWMLRLPATWFKKYNNVELCWVNYPYTIATRLFFFFKSTLRLGEASDIYIPGCFAGKRVSPDTLLVGNWARVVKSPHQIPVLNAHPSLPLRLLLLLVGDAAPPFILGGGGAPPRTPLLRNRSLHISTASYIMRPRSANPEPRAEPTCSSHEHAWIVSVWQR